jgi:hypothetical protein
MKTLIGNNEEITDPVELAKLKEENMEFVLKDIAAWERARFLLYHNCNPFPFNLGEVLKKSKQEVEMKLAISRSIK